MEFQKDLSCLICYEHQGGMTMNTIRSPCVKLPGHSNRTLVHNLHFLWEGKDEKF